MLTNEQVFDLISNPEKSIRGGILVLDGFIEVSQRSMFEDITIFSLKPCYSLAQPEKSNYHEVECVFPYGNCVIKLPESVFQQAKQELSKRQGLLPRSPLHKASTEHETRIPRGNRMRCGTDRSKSCPARPSMTKG